MLHRQLLLASLAWIPVCRRVPSGPDAFTAAAAAAPGQPRHGGVMLESAGFNAEVVTGPQGRVAAYLTDAQQHPMAGAEVTLSVQPSGAPGIPPRPLTVTYDPTEQAYVGYAVGAAPGPHTVAVSVKPTADAQPIALSSPPLPVSAVVPPPPRHGGRIELVGNNAVEVVAPTHTEPLKLYWTNLEGQPLPPTQVQVPSLTVRVGGRPRIVQPTMEGDHFAAPIGAPVGASVSVSMPSVVIAGTPYLGVTVAQPVVVVAVPPVPQPPGFVVAAGAPGVEVQGPGVVVQRPGVVVQAPGVVVGGPGIMVGGPGIMVGGPGYEVEGPRGHYPHGRARGWWGPGPGGPPGHGGGWGHGHGRH